MIKTTAGTVYILISALFYGSYGIWSRLMSGHFTEFTQAWTRGLFLLICLLILNVIKPFLRPIQKQDFGWFLVIALCGGLNQAPYFYGFEHLGIGTATLLFYAALVGGGYLLGKLFFAEKITITKWLSLGLAIAGMASIYGLSLEPDQYVAAFATVIAGLMGSTAVVLSKKLSGNYPEFQIMIGYFSVMVVVNGIMSIWMQSSLPPITAVIPWIAQFAYAIAMLIANYAAIEGFKYLEPTIGSLIGLAEILFGIIFGILFFGENMTLGVIVGSLLILASATLPNLTEIFVCPSKHQLEP